ncbi:PIN-like domain-containing protein [Photobacterium chitinilyticum]|uniref:PIN like domain-containing protein n=1 Tax=Photobacterium chitinilyticum TaxID=2485123 RepID=A0A3S3UL22_9GAMM|nr:PIN-like domain-containing protein [Photobacterium chitinilyticum]RWX54977.1 hypothetical protein EDI28_14665 [Photobacterium chitinilyticum]
MKDSFRGFSKPNKEELTLLWDNAIFVFDTNVFTNLYRYQSDAREAFFKIMEQLQARIWVPHHVGLEYQRNRLTTIEEQHQLFDKTKETVKKNISGLQKELSNLNLKNRNSHINPDKLISDISSLADDFYTELDDLESRSMNVNSEDFILQRLETLLDGKVGEQPSQECINIIEEEGKVRYENLIPPGYKDAKKSKNDDDSFTHGGVLYHKQYGDLIVWQQIISRAKDENLKSLIFITGDKKEDWWHKVKGKTTGFRPELVDEIYNKTELDYFYAYNIEPFINYARDYLNTNVSDGVIAEIREVTNLPSLGKEERSNSVISRIRNFIELLNFTRGELNLEGELASLDYFDDDFLHLGEEEEYYERLDKIDQTLLELNHKKAMGCERKIKEKANKKHMDLALGKAQFELLKEIKRKQVEPK